MQPKLLLILPALLLFCLDGFSQSANDTLRLTLQQVVEMAKGKSIAAKQA
ncbi:MAG: TolC family protein, partial [Segetibacter sp.]|nr:TolC family protein [Segetibacter sp.]